MARSMKRVLFLAALAAPLIAARPASAQRRIVTYTPFPVTTGTWFSVRPGVTTTYGFGWSNGNFPFFQSGYIGGSLPFPPLGGGYGAGVGGGAGTPPPGGGASQQGEDTGGSGSGQQATKKHDDQQKAAAANDGKDEGRLAGAIAARLVRVDGEVAIVALNGGAHFSGREAWVDVPTDGTKLAASRALYRLGTVTEPGTEAGTLRVRIEHPAKEPGLVDAMPVWLLLPAGQSASTTGRPGDRHAAEHSGP